MRIFIFSLITITALAGCRIWDPTFMPAGYKFHHNTYNSPPGPEAPDLGYEYSPAQNEAYLAQWRSAVRDMLLKTRAEGVSLPTTLNLVTDLTPNAFSNSYDYILREGLRAYGHVLSDAEDAPKLFYSAYLPGTDDQVISTAGARYNGDESSRDEDFEMFTPKLQDMDLVIGTIENGALMQNVRGTYELPVHGYVPGAYVEGHDNPLNQNHTPVMPLFNE